MYSLYSVISVPHKHRINIFIIKHIAIQEQKICQHFTAYRWFFKNLSPIQQNWFSGITTCSPFRFTYSSAGTEYSYRLWTLVLIITYFHSRTTIGKE